MADGAERGLRGAGVYKGPEGVMRCDRSDYTHTLSRCIDSQTHVECVAPWGALGCCTVTSNVVMMKWYLPGNYSINSLWKEGKLTR